MEIINMKTKQRYVRTVCFDQKISLVPEEKNPNVKETPSS